MNSCNTIYTQEKRDKAALFPLGTNKNPNLIKTERMLNQKSCRVCLRNTTISLDNSEFFVLSSTLNLLTKIDLLQCDQNLRNLCETCVSLIKGAIVLQRTAEETDLKLRNQEMIEKETLNCDDDASNHDYDFNPDFVCKTKTKTVKKLSVKTKKYTKCKICNRVVTVNLYKRHLSVHQSAQLICEVCGKLYRKDNLIRHIQLHNKELKYQCQICPYRTRLMDTLKVHMRTHSGDKPYSCKECQLTFITKSNLNRHALTHAKEKPFKCEECNKGFYTKREMDSHFKVDHVGLKEFMCRICGNNYGTRSSMMKHELRVHKRVKLAKGRKPMYLQDEFKITL